MKHLAPQDEFAGPVLVPAGTTAKPGLSFEGAQIGSNYTGFAADPSQGAGAIALYINGVVRWYIRPDGSMGLANGTAVDPAMRFTSQPNMGLFRVGSNLFGVSVAGSAVAHFTPQGMDLLSNRIVSVGTPLYSADAATKQYVDAASVTPGAVVQFAGATAPTGWLLCDGAAVSRTTYAALYAVVQDTYGAGDGSTTFNLPDARERFPVGAADLVVGYELGDTGGAATVALGVMETPSHTHDMVHTHSIDPPNTGTTSDGHFHTGRLRYFDQGTGTVAFYTGVELSNNAGTDKVEQTVNTDTHSHSVNIAAFTSGGPSTSVTGNSEGLGLPHENRPPYLAFNFIIKT